MNLNKFKKTLLVASFAAVSAYQVGAATDGVLGASSNGGLDITFALDVAGIIVDLRDFNLGNWSGTGELRDNDDLCIGTTGTDEYIIRADGQGAGNNFVLSNGTSELAYRVFWNDTIGTAGNFELAAGVQSTNMTNPPNTFVSTGGGNYICTGDRDANVEVVVEEAALQAAEAGAYSGVLTLTMVPQ
jgi:hypothetical protein